MAVGDASGPQAPGPGLVVVNGNVTQVRDTTTLTSIACPQANYCIAVGLGTGPVIGRLVVITDGQPGPTTSFDSYPDAIGCGSATSCWVTGSTDAFTIARLVHVVNGQITQTLSFKGIHFATFDTDAFGISPPACSSANSCIIVGATHQHRGPGLVFSLDGGRLTTLGKIPAAIALSGLACTSSNSCTAVGYRHYDGVVVTVKNDKLSSVRTLKGIGKLHQLACQSADLCYVFGNKSLRFGKRASFVLPIVHGKPANVRAIKPFIRGVFCTSKLCLAAGTAHYGAETGGVLFRLT